MLGSDTTLGAGHMVHRTRRATYQDILEAPENKIAELIDGELILSPWPTLAHSHCLVALSAQIGSAFWLGRSGPGAWLILNKPELHFDQRETVLVPDITGWRRERMIELPTGAGVELAPDWACEILSPATAQLDRYTKLPLYAAQGVPWLWLIDVEGRTLEIHRREPEGYLFLGVFTGALKVRAPPFDTIELDLSLLWGDVPAHP